MPTFTLNTDTAWTIFLPNLEENGFLLISMNVPGLRHYRISRERTVLLTTIDYCDFSVDFSTLNPVLGRLVVLKIPYMPPTFAYEPDTPLTLEQLSTFGTPQTFNGERFKLLFMTPTVPGDPSREVPAFVDYGASYSSSGNPDARFIYYIMKDGLPVRSTYYGNTEFPGQYDEPTNITTTEPLSLIQSGGINYYLVQVSTTPGMIITKGIPVTSILTDDYESGQFNYHLQATSGGVQPWVSSTGLRQNAFLAYLRLGGSKFPVETFDFVFRVEPAESIASSTVTRLTDYDFQFSILIKPGVTKMDLKVYVDSKTSRAT